MKTLLPWVLVAALLGGSFFLYSSGSKKDAQIADLQQQTAELANLRAENEKLKQVPDQSAELERLHKDNEDVLRLRSEVSQLRAQTAQLSNQVRTAQVQRTQTQAQAQQSAAEAEALRNQAKALQEAQARAQAEACINNLRIIDGAKQQWAMDNQKPGGALPTATDLAPYLPNHAMPVCPGGGTYSINAVAVSPSCNIAGHVLPHL